MIWVLVYAQFVTILAYNVLVHHQMSAFHVRTSWQQKDLLLVHHVFVLINILMIRIINYASLAPQLAKLVKWIRILAHFVLLAKIEFYRDNNASVNHHTMNLEVPLARNALINVKNVKLIVPLVHNVINHSIEL